VDHTFGDTLTVEMGEGIDEVKILGGEGGREGGREGGCVE